MRGAVSIALAYNQVCLVLMYVPWTYDTSDKLVVVIIDLLNMHACFQFTFSGVTLDPVHAAIITSTIVVVFFTTLVTLLPNPNTFFLSSRNL